MRSRPRLGSAPLLRGALRGVTPSLLVLGLMLGPLGGMLGCAHRARGGDPTPPSPQAVAPLSHAMLGTATGAGLASSEALDRLFDAPEVTAAGERLLARLGQDPSLVPIFDQTLSAMMQHPALLEAFVRLSSRDPSGSVDALGERVEALLSAGIDGPAFDAALDESLDVLLDRPAVDDAFGRMADVIVERSLLGDRIGYLMLEWAPELEATLGVPMDDERFAARLEQHLDEPARIAALSSLLSARLGDDPGLRRALAGLLDDAAFFAASTRFVHGVLTSEGFTTHATHVLAGMLDEVDANELRIRVERVLVTPAIERAAVIWVDEVSATQAFASMAQQLGLVLEDPNLQAELFTILVGAPPTA
ncbi:hypothetical protein [Paraliomyxa miuraensis]|uniref:hypothetical protein n=1 Tax=Paraliomyxa miuraensis TaxID=376150 RepID=UPI00225B094F|nr:hypothetical protein [Paraliomyxa miuraensis]MCX4248095.1 hypothetical protein [Paraliomyxa miuraensis]